MKARSLDRRITIERATWTANAMNEKVATWAPLATVWASKQDVRDSERMAAAELAAAITTRFQIRYSPQVSDIDARDRLTYAGQVYEIVAVKEIGRRAGIEITANARAEK